MSVNDPLSQPLMRVRQGKLIAGVCGGIAKWRSSLFSGRRRSKRGRRRRLKRRRQFCWGVGRLGQRHRWAGQQNGGRGRSHP